MKSLFGVRLRIVLVAALTLGASLAGTWLILNSGEATKNTSVTSVAPTPTPISTCYLDSEGSTLCVDYGAGGGSQP